MEQPFLGDEFPVQLNRLLMQSRRWPAAQQRLVPELGYGRYRAPALCGARPAAVCALCYPDEGQWRLPFILRPATMAEHAGQISFPGGVIDSGETDEHCALRELEEELGVAPESVQMLGRLSPIYLYSSHYRVQPFVATAAARPQFAPSPCEVAELLEVPLQHLLDRTRRGTHLLTRRGFACVAPHIEFQGHCIWGATAVILSELIAILEELKDQHAQ